MTRVDLDGQVAIVTGAGRGLGREYALELARRGASVVVNDVAGEHAEAVAREIRDAGGEAAAAVASVATPEGGAALVETAVERYGALHAVVSNAAVWRNAPFESMTADALDPVLDVSLRGAFFVARPAWPVMAGNGYGRIVLASSSAGAFGRLGGANYCAAKAGLLGLGRALALEGAPLGIRVNCVLPVAATVPSDPGRRSHGAHRDGVATSLATLRGRTEPARVAPLVALLASSACPISGEAISACGGRFARVVSATTAGWTSDDEIAPAEEIASHLDQILAVTGLALPASALDEIDGVGASLAARALAAPTRGRDSR